MVGFAQTCSKELEVIIPFQAVRSDISKRGNHTIKTRKSKRTMKIICNQIIMFLYGILGPILKSRSSARKVDTS